MNLEKMIRRASKIKLRGGVVGKVCSVLIVSSICIFGLGFGSGNAWIMAGGIAAIVLFGMPLLWKVIDFADRNPQAALLEGAEFLVHQQIVLGTKQDPDLIVTAEKFVEEQPLLEADPSEAIVLQDDVEEIESVAIPAEKVGEQE